MQSEEDQTGESRTVPLVPTIRPPLRTLGLRRLVRLCRKELREIVRDRRTIVTLILMPLLAYPLLSMLFHRLVFSSITERRCIVGVVDSESEQQLQKYLSTGQNILDGRKAREAARRQGPVEEEQPDATDELQFAVLVTAESEPPTADLEKALADGLIDLGVRIVPNDSRVFIPELGPPVDVELVMRDESPLGQAGAEFVEERMRAINQSYLFVQMRQMGRRGRMPVDLQTERVAASGSAVSLTAFVPLILILMTITGAVYPAIDLTAGERERGTLETLMAAPVPRFGLLFAKYIAVVTIAMLTATTNLVAMTATLMATGMGSLVFGPQGPTITLINQVFLLLMLFAAFFSAILLAITSFARSFKEAQSYLIPVMLITLAPGIMSLMPGLKFTAPLAVTPLLNIVLLARDLLEGNVDVQLATVAVVSTLFYAVAALSLAARIFGTDAVLYGSQATWSDLVRRPDRQREAPTVSGAMICLACIYPCYFLLANSLQRVSTASMATRLLMTGGVTVLLFVGLPLLAALLQRTRVATTFQLHRFGFLPMLGATCLGLSLWPFAHEVFMLNEFIGVKALDVERIDSAKALLASFRELSPFVILLSLAVAPAVCEEFFFRGYLLGSLKRSMPPYAAILVSALFFGVFHVITTSVLATERMLPSTFLGLILGWVCLRSGSLYPGIVLHGLHNGLLLMLGKYQNELMEAGWGMDEASHMPAGWLATAAIAVVVGVLLVTRQRAGAQ